MGWGGGTHGGGDRVPWGVLTNASGDGVAGDMALGVREPMWVVTQCWGHGTGCQDPQGW